MNISIDTKLTYNINYVKSFFLFNKLIKQNYAVLKSFVLTLSLTRIYILYNFQ